MSLSSIRWGGIALDDVQISTSRGRALLAHMPARGRGGRLEDRGPELRECRVVVKWTPRHAGDDPVARYQALLEKDDGKTRLLTHPLGGGFPARLSIESEDIRDGFVDANLRFVEDRGDARHSADAGKARQSAIQNVLQAARNAEDVLAHVPTSVAPSVAADSARLVTAWREPGASMAAASRQADADRQLEAIHAAIEKSRDAGHLDVYFALIDLGAALADASDAVSTTGAGLVELHIDEPACLLALCASMYGAASAEQRMADILRLNPLRTANAIPANTSLMVPGA